MITYNFKKKFIVDLKNIKFKKDGIYSDDDSNDNPFSKFDCNVTDNSEATSIEDISNIIDESVITCMSRMESLFKSSDSLGRMTRELFGEFYKSYLSIQQRLGDNVKIQLQEHSFLKAFAVFYSDSIYFNNKPYYDPSPENKQTQQIIDKNLDKILQDNCFKALSNMVFFINRVDQSLSEL